MDTALGVLKISSMKLSIRNIVPIALLASVLVQSGCEESEIPTEDPFTVTPFIFYPTADAMWIFKWREYPQGPGDPSLIHIDTLFLGQDTMLSSSTDDPESPYYYDVEPPSMKGYQLIKGRGVTFLPSGDKEYRSYGFTWFRQDSIEEKLYVLDEHDGVVIEYLVYDFGVDVGDTIRVANVQGRCVVELIDSVTFGAHYLKRINFTRGPSWSDGSYIQGFDLERRYWNVGEFNGPSTYSSYGYEWVKFIHGTDTLMVHYQ
jgi:hypothetical protein